MKKLFLILAITAIGLSGCKKINTELESLDGRLDKMENIVIPTVDEQITAINLSLSNLKTADQELKDYISELQTTSKNLQNQINETNTQISELESTLQNEILTATSEVLAQLNSAKEELEGGLTQINKTIENLQIKDQQLDNKIDELKKYVDTELQSTEDWVSTTFATLEQHNALVAEVSAVKAEITTLKESITALEASIIARVTNDIATAVAALNADIQQKVNDITTSYSEAIAIAKEDVTAAYAIAIQTAIADLEESMKNWVGEQLSGYYTIAEIDAKVTAIEKLIKNGDNELSNDIENLQQTISTIKTELTDAYQNAIEEAITTNNGILDSKLSKELTTINNKINSEVTAINETITELRTQVENNTTNITKLLERIQSVSYIPQYSDGKASVKYIEGIKNEVSLDFEISPKSAVADLANIWSEAISLKAIYTQTRAVTFTELQVNNFEADVTSGVISITASCENLSEEFFAMEQDASVALCISDGNNSIVSEYVPLAVEVLCPADDEIWYTNESTTYSTTPYKTNGFDANIESNTYDSEKKCWILKFDNTLTSIDTWTFFQCSDLTNVILPNSLTSINGYSFQECTSLKHIKIPEGVTSIGVSAFSRCYALISITLPESLKTIGAAFHRCSSLVSFKGKGASEDGRCLFAYREGQKVIVAFAPAGLTRYAIPDDVNIIGYGSFVACTELNHVVIPESVTKIETEAFSGCSSLAEVTIPSSVTVIGYGVFEYCSNLTSVYCKPTTPPTGGNNMFEYNAEERMIYVPKSSVEAYKTASYWTKYAESITY